MVADKTDSGPMNFVVAGTITIYNPAAIAQTFTVERRAERPDGTAATVNCPSYHGRPALGTVTCTYEASPATPRRHSTPPPSPRAGNPPQVATAPIEWTENLTGYDSGT